MENNIFGSYVRSISEFHVVYYVTMSVVILVIATACAMRVGVFFPYDPLPRNVTFISSILLLGVCLWLCVKMSYPFAYVVTWGINKVRRHYGMPALSYKARCNQAAKEEELARKEMEDTIMCYLRYVLPKFLTEEQIMKFEGEVKNWMENPEYRPEEILWLWKCAVSPRDMQHLIWNIAFRLGFKKGYGLDCAAEFAQAMFPELFKEMKHESIKNFTIGRKNPNFIPLDKPDKGSIKFHYEHK